MSKADQLKLLLVSSICFFMPCCKAPDHSQKDHADEQVETKLPFETDYPEGARSFLKKHPITENLDLEALTKGITEEKYTVEEMKFWISQYVTSMGDFDPSERPGIEDDHHRKVVRSHWADSDTHFWACCYFMGNHDPKWMLTTYFEKVRKVPMLSHSGSATEIDDSWLPSDKSWCEQTRKPEAWMFADRAFDHILYGWSKKDVIQLYHWVGLLESKTLQNSLWSNAFDRVPIFMLKRIHKKLNR